MQEIIYYQSSMLVGIGTTTVYLYIYQCIYIIYKYIFLVYIRLLILIEAIISIG